MVLWGMGHPALEDTLKARMQQHLGSLLAMYRCRRAEVLTGQTMPYLWAWNASHLPAAYSILTSMQVGRREARHPRALLVHSALPQIQCSSNRMHAGLPGPRTQLASMGKAGRGHALFPPLIVLGELDVGPRPRGWSSAVGSSWGS